MKVINKRIQLLANYYGFRRPADFAKKTGLSAQAAGNYLKSLRTPTIEAIEKIYEAFPEISAEWLLKGKGEMLKNISTEDLDIIRACNKCKEKDLNIDHLKELIQHKEETLKMQTDRIEELKERIKEIKKN